MATLSKYDKDEVKRVASGRWSEVFQSIGIDAGYLTGGQMPCPKCGGKDRFRYIDQKDGSLFCNQCFDTKNGDGLAAIMWFVGCNFQKALATAGQFFGLNAKSANGIGSKAGKKKKEKIDPAKDLRFLDWHDGVLALWLKAYPEISLKALKAVGARRCEYRFHHVCIAIPIIGENLAADQDPVGWALYPIGGGTLPTGRNGVQKKMKLTYGSKKGFVGINDHRRHPDKTILKVEGITDLLAAITLGHEEYIPVSTANGAGENWETWMIASVTDRNVVILHDNDDAGKNGAEKLVSKLSAFTNTLRNPVLEFPKKDLFYEQDNPEKNPVPIPKNDLRDWVRYGGTRRGLHSLICNSMRIDPMGLDESLYDYHDPTRLARRIVKDQFTTKEGRKSLVYWNSIWYHWDEERYVKHKKKQFDAKLTGCVNKELDRVFQERLKASRELSSEEDDEISRKKYTSRIQADILKQMESICLLDDSIELNSWLNHESNKWEKKKYISLRNTIVDLSEIAADPENGKVKPIDHSVDWFSPVCLPYDYDPTARCPDWIDFLNSSFGLDIDSGRINPDSDKIRFLQEWAGYCLLLGNERQFFLVLEGLGANGKSVYFGGIEALVGVENSSAIPIEDFGRPFSLAPGVGKLINVNDDCGGTTKGSENRMKSAVSGARMQLEDKGETSFTGTLGFKLMIGTNVPIRVDDKSDGFWRRMKHVPCDVTIPPHERKEGMSQPEWWQRNGNLPGMLNWAIEGYRRLHRQGKFTVVASGVAAIEEMKDQNYSYREFFKEHYISNTSGESIRSAMYPLYKEWCPVNGYRPLGRSSFLKQVPIFFPGVRVKTNSQGIKLFKGITRIENGF